MVNIQAYAAVYVQSFLFSNVGTWQSVVPKPPIYKSPFET